MTAKASCSVSIELKTKIVVFPRSCGCGVGQFLTRSTAYYVATIPGSDPSCVFRRTHPFNLEEKTLAVETSDLRLGLYVSVIGSTDLGIGS